MIIKSSTHFWHPTHTYRQSSLSMINSHTTEKFFLMTLSPDWEEDSYESDVTKKSVCGETGENEIYKATEIALCIQLSNATQRALDDSLANITYRYYPQWRKGLLHTKKHKKRQLKRRTMNNAGSGKCDINMVSKDMQKHSIPWLTWY